MGTVCELSADVDAGALERGFAEIERVERMLSTWDEGTELSALNERSGHGSTPVSDELFTLIDEVQDWNSRTNGAFNALIGTLTETWQIRESGRMPSRDEIEDATRRTRPENVRLDRISRSIELREGSSFEEGAFGKGYAIDRAIRVLEEAGSTRYLIDFGGQISVRSTTPVPILIASPTSRDIGALRFDVKLISVATTSGSEKWFETPDGALSHVIDPRTGRALPPRGSATVLHKSALVADILSTALYVMGPDDGIRWADDNGVAAIFIVPDGPAWNVVASEAGKDPSLGLTAVSADFRLKGNS